MINSLWISKTGMEAQQTQLDVISHNLANVSTTGFKRSTAVFEDLMYQNLRQVGANSTEQSQLPTGLQLGLGVRPTSVTITLAQGSLAQTGGDLDIAMDGPGYLEVTLPSGGSAYTRDGALKRSADGQIVTSDGFPLAPGITIPAEARSVSISASGEVRKRRIRLPQSRI